MNDELSNYTLMLDRMKRLEQDVRDAVKDLKDSTSTDKFHTRLDRMRDSFTGRMIGGLAAVLFLVVSGFGIVLWSLVEK